MTIIHTTTAVIPLLAFEQSTALMEVSGVTTITFFVGNIDHAAAYIRYRFAQIVRANPWLSGKLVKDCHSKQVYLHYDELPDSGDPFGELYPPIDPTIQISDRMEYGTLVTNSREAILEKRAPTRGYR